MTIFTKGMGVIKIVGAGVKKTPKTKSDFKLQNKLKRIQKKPDKEFKSFNPKTKKRVSDRTGFIDYPRINTPVKGSLGKKTHKLDVIKHNRFLKENKLIKD